MKVFILDPGHGMGNRNPGRYDPGATEGSVEEAAIAMDWVNEVRAVLMAANQRVVRTRINRSDPAPVGQRAKIAKDYKGDIMVSFHCNAATGTAKGTETFYRGEANKPLALKLNQAVVDALNTSNRGVKTESQSQHATLAIMAFQPCFLIELGFIDNDGDRAKMLDPELRKRGAKAIAEVLLSWAK